MADSLLACISQTARRLRLEHDAKLIDIAYWARTSEATVSRFEAGSRPHDLDRFIAAYSRITGVPAGDILRQAIDTWEKAGGNDLAQDLAAPV